MQASTLPVHTLLLNGVECEPYIRCDDMLMREHAAEVLKRIAEKHCKGRLVAVGGGGYNRANIGNAWTEVVKSLAS